MLCNLYDDIINFRSYLFIYENIFIFLMPIDARVLDLVTNLDTSLFVHTNNSLETLFFLKREIQKKNINITNNSVRVNNNLRYNNIYFEFMPFMSANDKHVIYNDLYNFCYSRNNLFYTENKKIVIIYNFESLYYQYQIIIYSILKETAKNCMFIFVFENTNSVVSYSMKNTRNVTMFFENFQLKKWTDIFESKNIKYVPPWQNIMELIVEKIFEKGFSAEKYKQIKTMISVIFITNIDGQEVIEYLFRRVFQNKIPENAKKKILAHFCEYDLKLKTSTKYIIHLECLIVHCINELQSTVMIEAP